MAEHITLGGGGSPTVTLALSDDGIVTVNRPGCGGGTAVLLGLALVPLVAVIAGAALGIGCMVWIAATERSLLALLVAVVFLVAVCPAVYTLVRLQGLLFRFSVSLSLHEYRIYNGFVRWRRRLRNKVVIVIFPTYSRGAWGYGGKAVLGIKALHLPLIPQSIVGTKHSALREAERVCEWLRDKPGVAEVRLAKWGDRDQVQPGVDYIR